MMPQPVDPPEALAEAPPEGVAPPAASQRAFAAEPTELRLDPDALEEFTAAVCRAIGTPDDIATDVATVLVAADRRGIASHGTARLPSYVALVDAGVVDVGARPVIDAGRGAFVRFDAGNGWGHHAGRVAIDWAIETARTTGIALASARNANHYGIAGWYALRAAAAGMIGISMTNTTGSVAPTRSSVGLIGTNPIAIAAPAGHRPAFSLDMATSTVPRGKLEVAERRGKPIPLGWAIDRDGLPTTDATAALDGALMPLGGFEETAGYKGYGLALAVDVLTGVLAGATFGKRISGLFDTDAPSDLGQLFLAIDPGAIGDAEAFGERLADYLDGLTEAPTAPDAPGRVLVPGEPEDQAEAVSRTAGVAADARHIADLELLAARFGIAAPVVMGRGRG
jgi:LDH2 family malate/lactate/ureidoglycolate dehydrogenase